MKRYIGANGVNPATVIRARPTHRCALFNIDEEYTKKSKDCERIHCNIFKLCARHCLTHYGIRQHLITSQDVTAFRGN